MPAINHWHDGSRLKRCIICEEERPLKEFSAYRYTTNQGKRSTRYESRCKPCAAARRRARYKEDPERDLVPSRQWKDKNSRHLQEYRAKRQKDPIHRANKAKAQRMRKARMRAGASKQCKGIRAIYAEAFRVEKAIEPCPVFDAPELGKKIHVDHIVPLSAGGRHEADNLQLLPAGINMRKGAKCQQ